MNTEPTATTPTLLTLPQAMTALGVRYGTMRKLVRAGELKFVKIGRRVLLPSTEISNFIAARLQTWSANTTAANGVHDGQ